MERDLFMETDKYLGAFTSTTLSMDDILPWEALRNLKNGLSSGSINLLRPNTGITSWVTVLRVFIEVGYTMVLFISL